MEILIRHYSVVKLNSIIDFGFYGQENGKEEWLSEMQEWSGGFVFISTREFSKNTRDVW